MKTYLETTTKEKTCLQISFDRDVESSRTYGSIGHLFTKEIGYYSPDGKEHALYKIMVETSEEASDLKEHIKLMKVAASVAFQTTRNEDLHIIEIHPVYRFEHGNVTYRRGTAHGFDYSNCGLFFVTAQSIEGGSYTAKDLSKLIDAELEVYSQWCNGEVYSFALYDQSGECIDSCGGFYNIEDIREHLPKEYQKAKLKEYFGTDF